MEDIYSSCCVLFNVPLYVARRIVPLLRTEDLKIACTKLIQAQVPRGVDLNSPSGKVYRNSLQKISHAFSVLGAYIELRNHEQKARRIREVDPRKPLVTGSESDLIAKAAEPLDPGQRDKNGTYFEGNIIPTRLRFGSYLYYSGAISYQMLEDALEWQKRRRPLMGQLAMERGIVVPTAFASTLFHLQSGESFGSVARGLSLMSEEHVTEITTEQKKYNCQLGQYFIEKAIFSPADLEFYIERFMEHNCRYAE